MRWNHLAPVLALSLLTALTPLVTADSDPAAPLLVEVQPDPAGSDSGNEWVEFANPSPTPLSLDGLYLTDNDACFLPGEGFVQDYNWPLNGTVPARGRLVLTLPTSCLNLANGGDDLDLITEDETVLQHVAYGTEGDLASPGDGQSLAACELPSSVHGEWAPRPVSRDASNPSCLSM